ncbi:WD40 repeat-like protein [Phlegmacium glaucopus]|nr:WD40 repeat-like protein [Phlegmacium glaucopus]
MHIVSASDDHTAQIWNTVTGECEAELKGHSDWVNSAVFSPDGMHIVSTSYDHTAQIWNTATGECEAELKGHSGIVNSALFSSDGMHIVSTSYDHTARIWNTATGECEAELKKDTFVISSSDNTQLHVVLPLPDGVFTWTDSYGQIHLSAQPSFLRISENTIFHTRNLQRIWLPPPFCKPLTVSPHLSKICLGYKSGETLVLEFLD